MLHSFIAHARYGHIFTSGLKSDVAIMFLNPRFPIKVEILAIRIHLRMLQPRSLHLSCFVRVLYDISRDKIC